MNKQINFFSLFFLLISYSINGVNNSFLKSSVQELNKLLVKNNCIKKCFFPSKHNIRQTLIELIRHEQKSIKAATYILTDKNIAETLIQAKKENNIDIELITDNKSREDGNSKINFLSANGINVYIFNPRKVITNNKECWNNDPIMHNKFFIFEKNFEDRTILWTGSFNFTNSAQTKNRENVIILDDKELAEQYRDEFEDIKKYSRPLQTLDSLNKFHSLTNMNLQKPFKGFKKRF